MLLFLLFRKAVYLIVHTFYKNAQIFQINVHKVPTKTETPTIIWYETGEENDHLIFNSNMPNLENVIDKVALKLKQTALHLLSLRLLLLDLSNHNSEAV